MRARDQLTAGSRSSPGGGRARTERRRRRAGCRPDNQPIKARSGRRRLPATNQRACRRGSFLYQDDIGLRRATERRRARSRLSELSQWRTAATELRCHWQRTSSAAEGAECRYCAAAAQINTRAVSSAWSGELPCAGTGRDSGTEVWILRDRHRERRAERQSSVSEMTWGKYRFL